MKIHFPKKEKSSEINIRPYWNIIFSLGFVLTLAAFVFGFYFFRQINRESVGEANRPSLHGKTVKKERIEKILEKLFFDHIIFSYLSIHFLYSFLIIETTCSKLFFSVSTIRSKFFLSLWSLIPYKSKYLLRSEARRIADFSAISLIDFISPLFSRCRAGLFFISLSILSAAIFGSRSR